MLRTLLFTFLFFQAISSMGQDSLITTPPKDLAEAYEQAVKDKDVEEQVRGLIRIGDYFDAVGNYTLSEEYFMEVLEFSEAQDFPKYIGNIKNSLAALYRYRGEYERSLELCFEAIEIETELNYRNGISLSYYNIATVFYYTKNYQKSQEYADSAIVYDQHRENKVYLINAQILKALAAAQMGQIDKAIDALDFSLEYYHERNDSGKLAMIYSNLGFIQDKGERNKEALASFRTAMAYGQNSENLQGQSIFHNNLAEQFLLLHAYDSCLYHADKSLELAEKIELKPSIRDLYELKAKAYKAMGNYEESLQYMEKFIVLKDEILNAENISTMEELESKYKATVKEKDLMLEKQKNKTLQQEQRVASFRIYILIVCVVLLVLLVFFIYVIQQRKRKHQALLHQQQQQLEATQKELLQSDLEKTALQNQQLASEVEYKNKELQTLAQHIVHKNDLLENLKEGIKSGNQNSSSQLMQLISVGMNTDKEVFDQHVDQISSLFFKKLKEQFPELNANDLRLLSLIKINMSSKEISVLMNINPKSVDMARYRVRKKMNLEKEVNLFDFLSQF